MMKIVTLNSFASTIAQTSGSQQGGPSALLQIAFFGLMFAAMYFLLIAPQRKKQKAHEKMLSALGIGDEVITSGGIYGVITNVRDDRFVVRISESTKIEIAKGFVQTVVKKSGAAVTVSVERHQGLRRRRQESIAGVPKSLAASLRSRVHDKPMSY